MILAAMTCLIFTIFLGPFFIRKLYAMKIGQPVRNAKECPLLAELHGKKKNTPTMGGVLILVSMLISLFLWMDLSYAFTWIMLFTTLVLGMIGGIDDYFKLKLKNSKGIRGRYKMLFQTLLSLMIALYLLVPGFTDFVSEKTGVRAPAAKENTTSYIMKELDTKEYMSEVFVPFFKDAAVYLSGAWIYVMYFLIFFVITGSSNAVNLTDGLDGLASGCLIMVASVFGFIAFLSNNIEIASYLNILYIEGSAEIAIYLFSLVGACLGFLWYNGHPAQVFMGDTGSLALGGVIGVSAILLRKEVLLAIVGGIFVAEALSVIIQVLSYRYRGKKRVFLCAPLHHHFEYKGWPETKVVLRFWIVGLFLAILGIASLKFQ